jgi:L-ascorbate metabolism protein UlaG (beta-lactamase superfamily)
LKKSRWMKRISVSTFVLVVVASVALFGTTSGCATFGALPEGARQERIEKNPNFVDGEFLNAEPTQMMIEGSASAMKDFAFGNKEMRAPICTLPLDSEGGKKWATPPESGLRITWLGHSTTLIELDGVRILTDPTWSERASPTSLGGPKRFHPPPVPFEALPPIDAVLISHDHYDHMDMTTIQALAVSGVKFYVGLGNGAHLDRWGVKPEQIVEVEWGQAFPLPHGVVVNSTPARHFSGRGLISRNRSLWTSWALVGPKHRVFFSGDTGLTDAFKEVGEKFGPFDVSMLEIGQWHPSWGQIHLGPEGAIAAHKMLGAKRLFPIHWSTFELGLHSWLEPAETLTTSAAKQGVAVVTPRLGQAVEPTLDAPSVAWWRAYPPMTEQCPAGTKVSGRPLADWPM